jgi:phosphohistidine phosphatase
MLRHAKSDWGNSSLDDHERPLNARGRRDAPAMGDRLRDEGIVPDVIITSDAVRAHTTALAVAEAVGYGADVVVEPQLYHASPEAVRSVLRSAPDSATTVMIVGHNPGLEDLLHQMTGERQDIPTAALAQLDLSIDTWDQLSVATRGTLVAFWEPRDLTA